MIQSITLSCYLRITTIENAECQFFRGRKGAKLASCGGVAFSVYCVNFCYICVPFVCERVDCLRFIHVAELEQVLIHLFRCPSLNFAP